MAQADPTFTFKNISNALKDVVDWKELGTQLGISYEKMSEIEKNNQKQVADCRRDLIQHWKETDVSCSWQKLCDALLPRALAFEIQRKYCPTYSGTQVTAPIMDTKCERAVILKISLLNFDWKKVGNRLLDHERGVNDIDREEHDEQNKRERMLLKWLQQKASKATYRRLVEVLRELKNEEAAEEVTRLVTVEGGIGVQPSTVPQQSSKTQQTPLHSERGQPSIAARPIPPMKKTPQLEAVFEPIKTLAADEWKGIGKALHIKDVERIPYTPGITKHNQAYLREVLRRWLEGSEPLIEDVIRALNKCYRGEAAKELGSRFGIAGANTNGQEVASDGDGEDQDFPTPNETNPVMNQSSAPSETYTTAGSTPHLKVNEVKNDCWMVREGGENGNVFEAYKMGNTVHGIALIISNTEFDKDDDGNPHDRVGGEKDEPALQSLFKTLGYTAVLLTNLRGAQIAKALKLVARQMPFGDLKMPDDKKKLKTLSQNEYLISPNHDSFVLCLMSHGEEGVILGTDGDAFEIHDIYSIIGQCKQLDNKPKMVFVQACRGTEVLQTDAVSKPDDLLFSFATFIGHAAFRGKDGSWYVKELCSIFQNGYKTKDFMSMLTEVHNAVQKRRDIEEDGTRVRQTPHITGVLQRKVYFNLKC